MRPTQCSRRTHIAALVLNSEWLFDLGAQFPIALSSVALVLAAVVEVAACSAAGAYLGFLYGSSVGESHPATPCAACHLLLPHVTWTKRGAAPA